jgi:hypothetical protein
MCPLDLVDKSKPLLSCPPFGNVMGTLLLSRGGVASELAL